MAGKATKTRFRAACVAAGRRTGRQDQLHSAGMGAINRYIGASDLASVIGVSHVTAPSEEAEGMFRAGIGNPNALERIGALQIRMHLNE